MEKIYEDYSSFIEKCVRGYLKKTGLDENVYDDVHSEAVLAFLTVCRKFGVKTSPLDPIVIAYARNAMRIAMRKYIWRLFNMRGCYKSKIDDRRNAEFPTDTTYTEDFSGPEAEDLLKTFTPNERYIITLKLMGLKNTEIASVKNTGPSNVSEALKKMRSKANTMI